MKKLFIALICLIGVHSVYAQDDTNDEEKQKEGWTKSGTISLLFNQTAFNNEWQGGGTSNYAGNATIDYNASYKRGKITWDNTFLADYGMTKMKDQDFTRKTSDRLEINSVVGRQIKKTNWYYSFFGNFRSQFGKGYEFEDVDVVDPVSGDVFGTETVRTETTHFMSPGYLKFGPGMLWKKNENLKVNIAPATARFIFVDDRFTTIPGYEDGDYYGVDQGETSRFEFGASIGAFYKFKVVENVTMENVLNLYANYLEDPQNVDLEYTGKINMKINNFLSANFIFQAIYDDNAVRAVQIREVLGVGLNYEI